MLIQALMAFVTFSFVTRKHKPTSIIIEYNFWLQLFVIITGTSLYYHVASSMPTLCALCLFMFIVNDINPYWHLCVSFILIASKVRGKVASIPFEQFHKHSAEIITAAVFGKNPDGKVNSEVVFSANNLVSDTLSC